MELSNQQQKYVNAVVEHAPDLGIDTTKTNYSRAELRQVSMRMKGKVWIPNWITHDQSRRVSRGVFSIPEITEHATVTTNVPENVAPGHGQEGDNLSDAVQDDLSEFGNVVVGDDVPLEVSEVAHDALHTTDAF
tara:strand:+ start:32 stop:433 length:402 start_codon:yes stop_codon:yes gene_type:complete